MYEFLSFEESLERKKIRGRVLKTLEFNKIRDAILEAYENMPEDAE